MVLRRLHVALCDPATQAACPKVEVPRAVMQVIPFMTDGWGARVIGPWFGTGADRGIALVFVVTGILGLLVTGMALLSRPYRNLSAAYAAHSDVEGDALREGQVA